MNSGHDASEFVKHRIFVDQKITIFHKIENEFFFLKTKSLSLQVLLSQGWVLNVCPQWCWTTSTVHFAQSKKGKKLKKSWYPVKKNPAQAGSPKRPGLVRVTSWANFAVTGVQLCSTIIAIFPCATLS